MLSGLSGEKSKAEKVQFRRVQLDLPPKAFKRLKMLKEDTEASSWAEVIKNALKLYAATIDIQKAGNEFMLKLPDGKIVPYPIFKLD